MSKFRVFPSFKVQHLWSYPSCPTVQFHPFTVYLCSIPVPTKKKLLYEFLYQEMVLMPNQANICNLYFFNNRSLDLTFSDKSKLYAEHTVCGRWCKCQVLSAGVHKSQVPGCHGDSILYGGNWYLCALSVTLVSYCHIEILSCLLALWNFHTPDLIISSLVELVGSLFHTCCIDLITRGRGVP